MIKLAAEKSFNRNICPIMNIKGKTVQYPFKLKYNNYHLQCGCGIFGPKHMMIMDIIGTKLIHCVYENEDFFGRIPTNNENNVKKKSGLYMSNKLLKYITTHLSKDGIIPEAYCQPGKLHDIDKAHGKIKNALTILLNDRILRKELPFLRKYSSRQIRDMFIQTSQVTLWMNYPICFHTGNRYQLFEFGNFGYTSRLFTLENIKDIKASKNHNVLAREYEIRFNTILGYMFMQNMTSCYMDLLPGKFYEMSDYAQLYYRLLILSYFPNKKTGKTPKNPISIDEIRKRLVLKTKDTYSVRQIIRRILDELVQYKFIEDYSEKKLDMKYVYYYKRNSWKEITGEEKESETDLKDLGF